MTSPQPLKKEETKDERIQRLLESRGLLFDHIRKFGCITKCHQELFKRIDRQLMKDGLILDDLPPGDDCTSYGSSARSEAEKVLDELMKWLCDCNGGDVVFNPELGLFSSPQPFNTVGLIHKILELRAQQKGER